jgi:hypothetical protein
MQMKGMATKVVGGAVIFGLGVMMGSGVIWQPATAQSPTDRLTNTTECVLRNAPRLQNLQNNGILDWLFAMCEVNPRIGR